MTASDDYKTRGSSGFTREEIDDAWMERARKDFEAGEHEAVWTALKVIYDSKLAMPKWLYEAIIAWLDGTETDKQKRDRRRRVVDMARFGYALEHRQRGRNPGAAFGDASEEMREHGFAGSPKPGAVEDSYKKTRTRLRRHEAARMKKVPK